MKQWHLPSGYRSIKFPGSLPVIYLLPGGLLLILVVLWLVFIIPTHFAHTARVQQQPGIQKEKQVWKDRLDKMHEKAAYLQDIDQHFAQLIAKYHFPSQNINWLSHLQNMAAEQHDALQDGFMELRRTRLAAERTILLHKQRLRLQLIDIELEADYLTLVHWLLALYRQPVLLTFERFSLTASRFSADRVHLNMALAIYSPNSISGDSH